MKGKKYIGMIVSLCVMAFVLVACGGNDNPDDKQSNQPTNANVEENNEQDDGTEVDSEQAEKQEITELSLIETDNESLQEEDESSDDALKLHEIYGTASQREEISYDDEKGYYIMEIDAGISNNTNTQDVKEKWVAFAIPDGVSVADVEDIPSGMVLVSLPDGHEGIALKLPNMQGIQHETNPFDIPLIGVPDDNNPNENLYLYEVNGNEDRATLVGEIKSTRDIDFSVMKDS